jgi:sulfite reductase (NADPH) hemoprotein beta-component
MTSSARCACRTAGTCSATRRCCAWPCPTANSSRQLRGLARIARDYDRGYGALHDAPEPAVQLDPAGQERRRDGPAGAVDMHGIQTSGNCIRNITSDAWPASHPMRWSTRAPTARCCGSGARCTRSSPSCRASSRSPSPAPVRTAPRSAGTTSACTCCQNAQGEVGFEVLVGGGMGRTPVIATRIREFLPWQQILVYIEADRARLQPLRPARQPLQGAHQDPGQGRGPEASSTRSRGVPATSSNAMRTAARTSFRSRARPRQCELRGPRGRRGAAVRPPLPAGAPAGYARWLERNVHAHRLSGYRAVTLSLKRAGQAPGDVTDAQMDAAADLADRYSHGELRVTHDQNLLLPWVRESDLRALWEAAPRPRASPRRTSAWSPT